MDVKKRVVLPLVTLSMIVPGFGAVGSVTSAAASPSPTARSCIIRDSDNQVKWFGDASEDMNKLGEDIAALVDKYPDHATGTAFCSHYEGVAIYLANPTSELTASIDALAKEHPGARIETHVVAHSINDLTRTGESLAKNLGLDQGLVGWGPDIYDASLVVDVKESAMTSKLLVKDSVPAVSRESASPVDITFRVGGAAEEAATRRADSAPWYMGGELSYSHNGKNWVCSSGMPILVNGVQALLTAGHCQGSVFTNNGSSVGTQYTTTYPGNSDKYGDWKLIRGSSYARRVFSGGVYGSASLPITTTRWSTLPNGYGMCTSGRTTGQICAYKINKTGTSRTIDGVTRGHLIELYHGGSRDTNGFQGGDSGGLCYYANSSGVTAAGVVMGYWNWPSGKSYYCTDLMGIREWNSSAVLGGS